MEVVPNDIITRSRRALVAIRDGWLSSGPTPLLRLFLAIVLVVATEGCHVAVSIEVPRNGFESKYDTRSTYTHGGVTYDIPHEVFPGVP